MGFVDVLMMVLIAGICGFLASQLMGARRINIVVMVILGFLGALIGRWIADYFGLPLLLPLTFGDKTFPLVWAIIGSVVLVGIVSLIRHH